MNIAINGFGRIGRLVFRQLIEKEGVRIVGINDLTDNRTLAHLLTFDTAHGTFSRSVEVEEGYLIVDGNRCRTLRERDPEKLPWKELEVDIVIECTGIFRTQELLSKHLKAGAKKVILSAPPKGDDITTIVLGVNDHQVNPSIDIFSNASCTTNCLAPQVKLLNDNWGITQALMTTTHAFTASQNIQDGSHDDLRRARAASQNIIPTSTGAAKATEVVYPAIRGKIHATAIRVPILVGSLTEMTFLLSKKVTAKEINEEFLRASKTEFKGIIQYVDTPIVSSDIIGNRFSTIFDSELTYQQGELYRITCWYDNETGYSSRLADLCLIIGNSLNK